MVVNYYNLKHHIKIEAIAEEDGIVPIETIKKELKKDSIIAFVDCISPVNGVYEIDAEMDTNGQTTRYNEFDGRVQDDEDVTFDEFEENIALVMFKYFCDFNIISRNSRKVK